MKFSCIAIDDEPIALDIIEDHVSKIPFLELKASFQNPLEAIEFLDDNQVDLIFLDIQMPELTGFEFLRTLDNAPFIVFTTAYPDYALESYELEAIDYLVKPIAFERLLKAVNKVKKRINNSPQTATSITTSTTKKEYVFVKTDYKTVKIFLDDILYIESLKDYVAFHLKGDKILSLLSIRGVEAALGDERFVRVHRSFIINLDKIDMVERNIVSIEKIQIPVGESYRSSFKGIIESNRLI